MQALTGFLSGVPSDCGVAIVIVTHLNPDRPSMLHEVLKATTPLQVKIAREGEDVRINHVYVMPENAVLGIRSGRLTVTPPERPRRHKPVDAFFRALARDAGSLSAGIVLSGGDGDGTLGIVAIRSAGGLTLAQEPAGGASGPQQPSMPESAIATGMVDLVLPVEQMGEHLARFARNAMAGEAAPHARPPAGTIFDLLLKQTGHDFSGYKRGSIQRRIARNMEALGVKTEADYVARLRVDPEAVGTLFRSLLISVTGFFRDPDAFATLAGLAIPEIFRKAAGEQVRVWAPGCSTGQEAYSLAILLREHAATLPDPAPFLIFATDIDEDAILFARAGRYSPALMEGVSPARQERFFDEVSGEMHARAGIRDNCVFAVHNILRDPAFSRLDLISCRNLLIYFDARSQKKVIPGFHRAMRPGGYLFLGKSEFVGQHAGMFEAADAGHRIFRSTGGVRAGVAVPGDIVARAGSGHRAAGRPAAGDIVALAGSPASGRPVPQEAGPMHAPEDLPAPEPVGAAPGERAPDPPRRVPPLAAAAFIIADATGRVRSASPEGVAFLEGGLPGGDGPGDAEPWRCLDRFPGALSSDTIAAAIKAAEQGRCVSRVGPGAAPGRYLDLTVTPLVEPERAGQSFIVALTDREGPPAPGGAGDATPLAPDIDAARQELRRTVEAYETALEELTSSNEELLASNEESQSINEEVEASREELQSLNEEMSTINAELTSKVEALGRSNADIRNLFESTQIATIFLDDRERIRTFTPAARDLFSLISGDEGRPLSDLAGYLAYPGLAGHIRAVLTTGETLERHVSRADTGAHYLIRILPYQELDRTLNGVVLTFLDVTQLTDARAHIEKLGRAEAHQRILIGELNHRVKNMLGIVIGIVTLTAGASASPEAFRTALIGRLQAMSRAYELLSRENWVTATVADLVGQEFGPFDSSQVEASGPEVRLAPEEALAISVVLHELTTNAAKYGALSKPGGRVTIGWTIAGGAAPVLEMTWRETGGPPVPDTPTKGFGLNLIEREVTAQFGGAIEVAFEETGLVARIGFPIMNAASA